MSARAVVNRQILLNITNMDENIGDMKTEKSCGEGLRDAEGVRSSSPTTPAAMVRTASPGGENAKLRGKRDSVGKIESGSGSGDPDQDGGVDVAAKKRKTRRGKPKRRKLKPYSKQQLARNQQGLKSRVANRAAKIAATGRQPPAPYNTTQFLMEDHSDLPDLEQKLSGAEGLPVFQKPPPPRTRDSSFSVDSDEDYFYSSPEDEEEFLTKEFSSAYEDLHAERLGTMTKPELIQEYVQLEGKIDLLTKRLRGKNFHQMEEWKGEDKNTTGSDSEIAKKLKICQQKIDDLVQQNEQLRRENEILMGQRRGSVVSSVDSESESEESGKNAKGGSCGCMGRSPNNVRSKRDGEALKGQRRSSPLSSVDSESDSDSSSSNRSACSCNGGSPKPSATPTSFTNGHTNAQEVNGLPT